MAIKKKAPRVESREICVIHKAPEEGVLGAAPSPGEGYTNHIGSTRDGAGNSFWAITVDGPNTGDLDVSIQKRQQGTGDYSEVYRFTEAAYGKHGYGGLEVIGSHLVCVLAQRRADGATVAMQHVIYYVATPWPGVKA